MVKLPNFKRGRALKKIRGEKASLEETRQGRKVWESRIAEMDRRLKELSKMDRTDYSMENLMKLTKLAYGDKATGNDYVNMIGGDPNTNDWAREVNVPKAYEECESGLKSLKGFFESGKEANIDAHDYKLKNARDLYISVNGNQRPKNNNLNGKIGISSTLLILAILGSLLIVLLSFVPIATGNVIGNSISKNIIGVIALLIGLFLSLIFFKKK